MVVEQLPYARIEVKSLEVVMKSLLSPFLLAYISYFNQKQPLIADTQKRKTFCQPMQYWGNIEERGARKAYPKLREYIYSPLLLPAQILIYCS